MYIVVRKNLTAGAKLAQSCHTAFAFAKEHSHVAWEWMQISNYICILESDELHPLIEKAIARGIKYSVFQEPDLDNQITAVALSPCAESKKICRSLKLAMHNITY